MGVINLPLQVVCTLKFTSTLKRGYLIGSTLITSEQVNAL